MERMASENSRYEKVQVWIYVSCSVGRRWLLLKTLPNRGGFWQPVTGSVESGESLLHAALREAKEETDCEFQTLPQPIGYDFQFKGQWGEAHETAFVLEAVSVDGKLPLVRLNAQSHLEHEAHRWCTEEEVLSLVKFETNQIAFQKTVKFLNLSKPARYFPIDKGVYEVGPGLKNLGTSFGNGNLDSNVFQLDSDFFKYRENKNRCRGERLTKYYCESAYAPEVRRAVNQWVIERLLKEHPHFFHYEERTEGGGKLTCLLTDEILEFDSEYELSRVSENAPAYASAFDALCSQVQEDVAVMSTSKSSGTQGDVPHDWLSAIHLCSPSHWGAEDKIGKNFFTIHQPIPGIDKMNQAAGALIDASIRKGPYTRFVWGFGTDARLNHHPVPPLGFDAKLWKGRSFDRSRPGCSPFILRVERQVIIGLPRVHAFVFTIRVSFIDGEAIRANPKEHALLRSGLLSMNADQLKYKGLSGCIDDVIAWLDET